MIKLFEEYTAENNFLCVYTDNDEFTKLKSYPEFKSRWVTKIQNDNGNYIDIFQIENRYHYVKPSSWWYWLFECFEGTELFFNNKETAFFVKNLTMNEYEKIMVDYEIKKDAKKYNL